MDTKRTTGLLICHRSIITKLTGYRQYNKLRHFTQPHCNAAYIIRL